MRWRLRARLRRRREPLPQWTGPRPDPLRGTTPPTYTQQEDKRGWKDASPRDRGYPEWICSGCGDKVSRGHQQHECIESLRSQLEKARAALERIADDCADPDEDWSAQAHRLQRVARASLQQEGEG